MATTPFMKFYPGDYLADTQHLTTEQHGAYMLILMAMWTNDGWVPSDRKKLARIARVSTRRWHLIADDVMALLSIEGDRVTQLRLLSDLQKCDPKTEKRNAKNEIRYASKSLKNNEPTPAPRARDQKLEARSQSRVLTHSTAREDDLDFAKEQHRAQQVDWEPECERFLSDYPSNGRPVAVRRVRSAFQTAVIAGADPAKIANAAARYARSFSGKPDDERRYIKDAHNFISDGIWESDFAEGDAGFVSDPELVAHWEKTFGEGTH